jgi:arsenate reductase-like glutaredoxin family protein
MQKFGVDRLLDREGRRFQDLGLQAARLPDDRWLDKMCLEPEILTLPLARWGKYLTVGAAEADWKDWIDEARNSVS